MVIVPTLATLATALPDTMPKNAEPTTATLAEPPRNWPISAEARSEKNSEPPQRVSTWPMMMNGTTTTMAICKVLPSSALVSTPRYTIRRLIDTYRLANISGSIQPSRACAQSASTISTSARPVTRRLASNTSKTMMVAMMMPLQGRATNSRISSG